MNKEQIYDEQIFPLMQKVLEICQEHHIAYVGSFAIPTEADPDLFCSSRVPNEREEYPHHLATMAQAVDRARGAGSESVATMTETLPDGKKRMTVFIG